MGKKTKKEIDREVDAELEAKSKEELLAEFAQSQALHVPAKKRANKLISIRLPMTMLNALRDAALKKGDVGYQQMIKIFIADGLLRAGVAGTPPVMEPSLGSIAATQGSSQICCFQTLPSVSGDYPRVA